MESIFFSLLTAAAGGILWLARITTEHSTRISAIEKFHDTMMKRMVDLTISPHTPELDEILRKIRKGEHLSREEVAFAVDECDKEFWIAKTDKQIGRAAALSVILAQLEAYKK